MKFLPFLWESLTLFCLYEQMVVFHKQFLKLNIQLSTNRQVWNDPSVPVTLVLTIQVCHTRWRCCYLWCRTCNSQSLQFWLTRQHRSWHSLVSGPSKWYWVNAVSQWLLHIEKCRTWLRLHWVPCVWKCARIAPLLDTSPSRSIFNSCLRNNSAYLLEKCALLRPIPSFHFWSSPSVWISERMISVKLL